MNASKLLILLLGLVIGAGLFFAGWSLRAITLSGTKTILPTEPTPVPTPLAVYNIENLANYNISTKLEVGELEEVDKYNSGIFEMEFTPVPGESEKKITSGQINIPSDGEKFPVVVMLRGYVDPQIYRSGMGTERAAEVFAQNGFITLSPDFLGYAESDTNAADIFESRFQTYTTVLSLVNSIDQIDKWDGENIFLWGHSNGGHIALAVLEITKANYPATLWAPVSKAFPFSILYYTDEAADKGKYLRSELARFEELYDVDKFSIHTYLHRITAPIQIHQGDSDDAIPVNWSENLKALIESNEDYKHEIDLFIYSGANHNLTPGWDSVVERDLEFFIENFK